MERCPKKLVLWQIQSVFHQFWRLQHFFFCSRHIFFKGLWLGLSCRLHNLYKNNSDWKTLVTIWDAVLPCVIYSFIFFYFSASEFWATFGTGLHFFVYVWKEVGLLLSPFLHLLFFLQYSCSNVNLPLLLLSIKWPAQQNWLSLEVKLKLSFRPGNLSCLHCYLYKTYCLVLSYSSITLFLISSSIGFPPADKTSFLKVSSLSFRSLANALLLACWAFKFSFNKRWSCWVHCKVMKAILTHKILTNSAREDSYPVGRYVTF